MEVSWGCANVQHSGGSNVRRHGPVQKEGWLVSPYKEGDQRCVKRQRLFYTVGRRWRFGTLKWASDTWFLLIRIRVAESCKIPLKLGCSQLGLATSEHTGELCTQVSLYTGWLVQSIPVESENTSIRKWLMSDMMLLVYVTHHHSLWDLRYRASRGVPVYCQLSLLLIEAIQAVTWLSWPDWFDYIQRLLARWQTVTSWLRPAHYHWSKPDYLHAVK